MSRSLISEPSRKRPANDLVSDVRRVEARNATGAVDIMQKYDPMNKNHWGSADNIWAAFFGAPASPWMTSSLDKYDRSTWNLPEAYVGSNKRLQQTIDELIYTEETFYTTTLLPYNFTDEMSIVWDKWEFNEHFTGIVPEQGVSRLVSSTRTQRGESFLRRGLGLMLEHGWMSTPQGRAQYFLSLAQIARAVQETTNFGVIYAYLTCHDYQKDWERKHGYFRKQTLQDMLERERFMWAILVKEKHGFEKLDAQIVTWMDDRKTSADTWVISPKPAVYLRLVPEEKTDYYLRGPRGPDTIDEANVAGRPHESNTRRVHDVVEPYAVFKKNQVFLTRTYHLDKGPIDLMTRVSSVGEYFKLVKGTGVQDYRNGYDPASTNVRFYDEDGDTGCNISKSEALQYTMVFDADGKAIIPPNNLVGEDANDMDGVFFLRRVVTDVSTGEERFMPIEFLGDIDPKFFGPKDAAQLAYAAIARAFPNKADRDQAYQDVRDGMLIINRLAMLPLKKGIVDNFAAAVAGTPDANLAGATSWPAINALAASGYRDGAKLGAFIRRVEEVAGIIGSMMGNNENIFVNPANAVPLAGYGQATPARVLYENLLNYNSVPVFVMSEQAAPVENLSGRNVAYRTGLEKLAASLLATDDATDAATLGARNVSEADRTALERLKADILGAEPTSTNYERFKMQVAARPEWSKSSKRDLTPDTNGLANYLRQLDRKVATDLAKTQDYQDVSVARRDFTPTLLAVSPNNPSLRDGSARAAGYAPASASDITRPSGEFEISSGDATVRIGANLDNIPIFQALAAAQTANERVGTSYSAGKIAAQSYAHSGANVDLDDYYDQEPIGQMVDLDPAEIRQNRRWVPEAGGHLASGERVNLRFGTLGRNLDLLARSTVEPLAKLVAALYYGAPWNLETVGGFEDNNVPGPFGVIGFRVGLYDMALGIKCKAGGSTGYTYFGHSDFMLADDAAIKIHYGNYTHYGKSVIHNPENVFIAYDIFPNRALGGMGSVPYTSTDQFRPEDNVRLADVWYVLIPYTETKFDTVMSMAGRFYSYMDNGMLDEADPMNRKLHYTTAPYYNRIWRWYSFDDVVIESDEPEYRMHSASFATEVWQGEQATYNVRSDLYNRDIIRNKSPWGPTGTGCRDLRNGHMTAIPKYTPGMLSF